ncbi:MAG TPA: DNA repair protein RecN [Geobacteraceae bacterium]|nr:DNA repair protein RecN [Geobacteraceae bacterium]
MLTDLFIKNFAIIDSLHLLFGPGLNVLTGETGAGKSIIIGAIGLILGGRSNAEIIRTGEEEAVVEAIFDLSGQPEIEARLAETGIDVSGELLVKRVVARTGKNRVYLNGGLSTTSILSAVSGLLVNIYGQHESQTLVRPENHLSLLDCFGGLQPLQATFSGTFADYGKMRGEIKKLEEGERDALARIDLLSFQSGEIGRAELRANEEEDLFRERQILANAEKLLQNSRSGFETLYGADLSVLGMLTDVREKVAEIASIDETLAGMVETMTGICLQVEDAGLALRDYSAGIEADPERLREVDDRLDLIGRLKKKYAPTIEEILSLKERIDRDLERLAGREQARGDYEKNLAELEKKLSEDGRVLGEKRREAALALKRSMEKELRELAMKNALFEISFEVRPEPGPYGMEKAEFLLSSNPGETPKSLSRIASGGELSRLMLALKQLLPESDVPTLVFDEVDSGVGGATSVLVGRKLKKVARRQQVLCITHLPQVAAFADRHFRVEKKVGDGRTTTSVSSLAGEDRVAEMARMLGGMKISERSLEHAREMIEEAAAYN